MSDIVVAIVNKLLDFKTMIVILMIMGLLRFDQVKELIQVALQVCK